MSISQNLTTSVTRSQELQVRQGERLTSTWVGTHTGAVALVDRSNGGAGLVYLDGSATVDASASATITNDYGRDLFVSFVATGIAGAESVAITLAVVSAPVVSPSGEVSITGHGAPTDAVTGANVVPIGGKYTDLDTGDVYRNIGGSAGGTQASPVWKATQLVA